MRFFVFSPLHCQHKGGSRILARGVHMSDGNAQEAQSLYVRQCIIHAFKRVGLRYDKSVNDEANKNLT